MTSLLAADPEPDPYASHDLADWPVWQEWLVLRAEILRQVGAPVHPPATGSRSPR